MEKENKISGESIERPTNKKYIFIGIILFFLSIISTFVGGLYFGKLISINNQSFKPIISPTSIPKPITITQTNSFIEEKPENNSLYIKNKQYFEDTLIAITNSTPNKIIVATITRQEVDSGSNQNTRVSYFDGKNWIRKTTYKHYDTAAIYTNNIINKWNINIDESRVLKQNVVGTIKIDNNIIDFDTKTITNNITIRSLPGYTKFMSTSEGDLIINGVFYPSKILYTRIYSNNSKEIQFYDTPLGLTTYWLVFWDENGNFYHVDSTYVNNPTDIYKTHQLGVVVKNDGSVTKTFEVKVDIDNNKMPHLYNIELGSPLNKIINFIANDYINKAPNNSYNWYMSSGIGEVNNLKGEYIHY